MHATFRFGLQKTTSSSLVTPFGSSFCFKIRFLGYYCIEQDVFTEAAGNGVMDVALVLLAFAVERQCVEVKKKCFGERWTNLKIDSASTEWVRQSRMALMMVTEHEVVRSTPCAPIFLRAIREWCSLTALNATTMRWFLLHKPSE